MEDKIVLYSTATCQKCKFLKQQLQKYKIDFEVVDDIDKMLELGITMVPQLYDGHSLMNYTQAMRWLVDKSQEVL